MCSHICRSSHMYVVIYVVTCSTYVCFVRLDSLLTIPSSSVKHRTVPETCQNSVPSCRNTCLSTGLLAVIRLCSLEAVPPLSYSVSLLNPDAFVSSSLSSPFVPRLYSLLFISPHGVALSILHSDTCQPCNWSWLYVKIVCSCEILDLRVRHIGSHFQRMLEC